MASELSPRLRLRRLVLALDSSRDDRRHLAAAAGLAARMQLELSGLFVEDSALHRLAGLPFAVEVSVLSAQSRRFAANQLQRSLRIRAARLELALSNAAHAAGVRWSFHALRGRPVDDVLAAATERDLVLLTMGASPWTGGDTPRTRPVAVVLDAASSGTALLAVAVQLAEVNGRPLLVLVGGNETEAGRLRERARTELAAMGIEAAYVGVRGGALRDDVLGAAARNGADLLVVHSRQVEHAAQDALARARCPIAVVV